MTNREKINAISNQEMAEYICRSYGDCGCCPGYDYCEKSGEPANGMVKWLESEAEDEA